MSLLSASFLFKTTSNARARERRESKSQKSGEGLVPSSKGSSSSKDALAYGSIDVLSALRDPYADASVSWYVEGKKSTGGSLISNAPFDTISILAFFSISSANRFGL